MKHCVLLTALVSALAVPQSSKAVDYFNPVLNSTGNAWIVRYGLEEESIAAGKSGSRNKKGDCAVRLFLEVDGAATNPAGKVGLKGTLFRYDNVHFTGGKLRFKKRAADEGGEITLSGTADKVETADERRKPVRFRVTGEYTDKNGKKKKVWVKGFAHTGKDLDTTADNRLLIRFYIKNDNSGGGGGGNAQSGTGQAAASKPSEDTQAGCRDCDDAVPDQIDGQSLMPVALFQDAVADPCEQEPDTDVLMEEDYVPTEDPPVIPDP